MPKHIANKNRPREDLLVHLALSFIVTYFILFLIEQKWPNSVEFFLNITWLLGLSGGLIIIYMIIIGFKR